MKRPNRLIMIIQTIFTILGGIIAALMFKRVITSKPDLLTIVSSIVYLLVYLYVIFYSIFDYRLDDKHYELAVYAYAALLGVEILVTGKFIAGYPLSESSALVVGLCNLISFAFVIKFSQILDKRKEALTAMSISLIVKYFVEFWLIISLIKHLELIHILTALSVPVLGTTILLAYTYCYGNN